MDTLIVMALLLAAGYVLACAVWPFAACRRCKGAGRLRSPGGKAWRACPRCDGSKQRVRVGRRVYEMLNGAGE